MAKNKKPKSYFEQMRIQNNDPAFYNGMRQEEIERQVKRICKDIRNGNILEQDYVYFKNDRIISACLRVSYTESRKYNIIAEALGYYNNTQLMQIMTMSNYSPDALEKRGFCTNAYNEASIKASIWNECYLMFDAIFRGNDVESMLNQLQTIDAKTFNMFI